MSDSSDDVPIASAEGFHIASSQASASASASPDIFAEGPLIMVAIIAEPLGRWHDACFHRNRHLSPALRKSIQCNAFPPLTFVPPQNTALVGFAVLRAWHFLNCVPNDNQSKLMMHCCKHTDGSKRNLARSIIGYSEHKVAFSASLVSPIDLPQGWSFRNPSSFGRELLEKTTHCDINLYSGKFKIGVVGGSTALVDRWNCFLGELSGQCFPWPLWTPLACKIVHGHWAVDITKIVSRERTVRWLPPIRPSSQVKREYMHWVAQNQEKLWSETSPDTVPVQTSREPKGPGQIPGWDSRHIVNAVRFAEAGKSQREAMSEEYFHTTMKFLFPNNVQEMIDKLRGTGFDYPIDHTTIENARIRLDVCSMLAHRTVSKSNPSYRYLFFDASPQRSGREVFATCERLIPVNVIECNRIETIPASAIIDRKLPICGLGQGRTTVADKVSCLIHQCWLEYGPSSSDIRTSNARVRQCLSDMGTEFAICDYPDVIDQCMVSRMKTSGPRVESDFLFPLALKIPGSLHLIDWVLKRACCSFSWWPEWSAKPKLIMQFLSSQNQRERMQAWISEYEQDTEVRDTLVRSLDRSANRFAKWRWQTLREVIVGMLRMRNALKFVASGPNASKLFSSKEDKSRELCNAIIDDATWARTEALRDVLRPLTDFSGWIRGCACHEAELKRGIRIQCPWKGCRGPLLASKLNDVLGVMHNIRESFEGNDAVTHADMSYTIGMAMSDLSNKFHWVKEPPYLIWLALISLCLIIIVFSVEQVVFGTLGGGGKSLCVDGTF